MAGMSCWQYVQLTITVDGRASQRATRTCHDAAVALSRGEPDAQGPSRRRVAAHVVRASERGVR